MTPATDMFLLKGWFVAVAGIALMCALLLSRPLEDMGLAMLAVTVVVLAWIAYQYLEPLRMMRRHAVLLHVLLEGSALRRFFWKGSLLRIGLVIGSLLTAALALIVSVRLTQAEWAVLLGSVPVFILVCGLLRGLVRTQVAAEYRTAITLRWAYRVNLALMVIAVTVLQTGWVSVPVTTHLSIWEVASSAWDEASAPSAVPAIGWLLGIGAAFDDVMWHLMQLSSATAEGDRWLQSVFWVLVLAWSALRLGVIWLVFVGMISMALRQQALGWRAFGDGPTAKAFSLTMLVLFLAYLIMSQVNLSGLLGASTAPIAEIDVCDTLGPRERQAVAEQASGALRGRQIEFDERMGTLIEEQVRQGYALAEVGVERFLDWNFSVLGQYQQLIHLGVNLAPSSTSTEAFIAAKIDEHLQPELGSALARLEGRLSDAMRAEIEQAFAGQEAIVSSLIGMTQCVELPTPTFELEGYMQKSLVGAGSGAGIVVARLGSGAGSRLVGRTAVRRILSAIPARLAAKAGATTASGATGVLCGPLVVVCAPVLALGTWFGMDYGINALDEALNRDDLREEMLAALDADRIAMETALRDHYALSSGIVFGEIEEWQSRRFNLYQDGMAKPQ